MKPIPLDDVTLIRGKGTAEQVAQGEMCIEQLIGMYAVSCGVLPPNWDVTRDDPPCVCPVVRRIAIAVNDDPNATRQWLVLTAAKQIGTANDGYTQARAFLCADYAVRRFAPKALRAGGRAAALQLESLPEIVDQETALEASRAARALYAYAAATYAAAYAAAHAATYAADAAHAAAYAAAYAADAAHAAADAAHAAHDAAHAAADAAHAATYAAHAAADAAHAATYAADAAAYADTRSDLRELLHRLLDMGWEQRRERIERQVPGLVEQIEAMAGGGA